MRIYTRSGDAGKTGLLFGGRVSKSDPRCEAEGAVDQAVSAMGLARSLCRDRHVKQTLLDLQRQMFTAGAELVTHPDHHELFSSKFAVVTPEMVDALESLIDEMDAQMDRPNAFVVPGASAGSGALDLARSLLRTAERRAVGLHEQEMLANPEVLRYLNRLADALFVLARYEDRELPLEIVTGTRRESGRTQ
jgi:cob(I)alamin adenosyltransferase